MIFGPRGYTNGGEGGQKDKPEGGELGNDSGERTCRHGEEVILGQRKPSDNEIHGITNQERDGNYGHPP